MPEYFNRSFLFVFPCLRVLKPPHPRSFSHPLPGFVHPSITTLCQRRLHPRSRNHGGERVGADASPLGSRSAPICICSFPSSADGRTSRSPDARRLLLHRQAKTLMPQLVSAPNYSPFSGTHTDTNKLVQARAHTRAE